MTKLEQIEEDILDEFKDFELVSKDDSFLMKLIGFLLYCISFGKNRAFMTMFVTTIGQTVYTPSGWDLWSEYAQVGTLRHERVHMRQARRYTLPLFSFLYLLFPLPMVFSYYRMKFEKEAYEESIKARIEFRGIDSLDEAYKDRVVLYFTGSGYLWTWPWRKSIESWYDETVKKLTDANAEGTQA